jgi:alpha-N-acetylglucosaminidase
MLISFFSLHRYLTDVVHVDIYWFIGSRLNVAPSKLPNLTEPIRGFSTVPWRYHFNTGTLCLHWSDGSQ